MSDETFRPKAILLHALTTATPAQMRRALRLVIEGANEGDGQYKGESSLSYEYQLQEPLWRGLTEIVDEDADTYQNEGDGEVLSKFKVSPLRQAW